MIPASTISAQEWQNIGYEAGIHPGGARRHRYAPRFLYQLMTGADLNDSRHALTFDSPDDRGKYLEFTETLSLPIRDALTRHATSLLQQLGIDEPLMWQPPPECCSHLQLPGTDPDDIDLEAVHQLAIINGQPLSTVSDKLGTTIEHIRLALEQIPQPPGRHDWGRRHQARARFTRGFFEREYLQAGKRLKQIAAETGYDRRFLAECAKDAGIPLATARHTTPIDEDWLREQYLKHKRSFPTIARQIGVSEMTVNRAAHRFGISVRPAGVASHEDMLQHLDQDIPSDIRRAVEGGRYGWQRLHRFEIAMSLPTIEQTANHIGATKPPWSGNYNALRTTSARSCFTAPHQHNQPDPPSAVTRCSDT